MKFDPDGICEPFTYLASIDSPLEDWTWSLNSEVLAYGLRPSWLIWIFLWTLHKILMENWKIDLMQFWLGVSITPYTNTWSHPLSWFD